MNEMDNHDYDLCNLVYEKHLNDDDHIELIEGRSKLKGFLVMHRLITRVNMNIASNSKLNVNFLTESATCPRSVDDFGHDLEEEESLHSSSNDEGEEEEDVIFKRENRFTFYNKCQRNPEFIVGMTFGNATEFKESIFRYLVAKQTSIKYTKNTTKCLRAMHAQINCK